MNEEDIITEFANKIVEKGLSVPAIFLLESTKYISFIAGQILIFLGPILTFFVSDKKYNQFIEIIEKRENLELLMLKIEELNAAKTK